MSPARPTPPAAPVSRLARLTRPLRGGWFGHPRPVIAALTLLSLLPVVYVFVRTAEAWRNIVYWDEFDTALALLLRLHEGVGPGGLGRELFALANEHRMVTSRLLFATSYWLTGTIDFSVIGAIGNATIPALCLLLIATAGTPLRRLRLGVLLSLWLFQLEHYENYLWSGASIDHFQIVLLAAGTIVALSRATLAGVAVGGLLATLATFTLAHGLVLWPVGAAMLWRRPRRPGLGLWCAIALVAVGGFLTGFKVNTAQSFVALSFSGVTQVLHYWLSMLGAAPALGHRGAAPWLGVALLALLGYAAARGGLRRERIVLPLAAYALGAMALIAVGRAAESGGLVHSRYYVLSALAWALALFLVIERHSHPRRPLRLFAAVLPSLLAFNYFADREFTDEVDSWLECRNLAVASYQHHGVDGRGPFSLHPAPAHATALLQRAEAAGIYRLGSVCRPEPFPRVARESNRLHYFVDEISVNAGAAALRGWAAIPGQRSRRGSLHLVLRSGGKLHAFSTVTFSRPDVAAARQQPGWTNAGFYFAAPLATLPPGEFQVGFLIENGARSEFMMTGHRLVIDGPRSRAIPAAP